MSTAVDAPVKYFVARVSGRVDVAFNLADATAYADRLYRAGVVAPLVVRGANADDARARAVRCYRGEITTRQARFGA